MRNATFPDILISAQIVVTCSLSDSGCQGGDSKNAFQYVNYHIKKKILEKNITDETCAIYEAKGRNEGLECNEMSICKNCMPNKGCWAQEKAKVYGIQEYGVVNGETQMMNEIYTRGP